MNEQHLKRLGALWVLLAKRSKLSEFVESKDLKVFERRLQGEGLLFLTTVLPRLGKALDQSFKDGVLSPILGFNSRNDEVYPNFLRRAWETIFNKDGSPRNAWSGDKVCDAVACIRQLSLAFYKLKVPSSKADEKRVLDTFMASEDRLASIDLDRPELARMLKLARFLVCRMLKGSNPLDIQPEHGSGASSCGVVPWERWETPRWIPRLGSQYPYESYFFLGYTHYVDSLDAFLRQDEVEEPGAKLVFVPKDSRGPRLISKEPREFMFVQKGKQKALYAHWERTNWRLAMIAFTDQSRNRNWARIGSRYGTVASMDLTSASDLVSCDLVEKLFPPLWRDCLMASRSAYTESKRHNVRVELRKFAPMGSAVCFPVEAICFWAVTVATIYLNEYPSQFENGVNRRACSEIWDLMVSRCKVEERRRQNDWHPSEGDNTMLTPCSIFGDDIIVDTRHYRLVADALESVGLSVNRGKSYAEGPFRESCGGDFFNGVDVTPVRFNNLPGDDKISACRYADMLNNIIARYGYGMMEWSLDAYNTAYGPIVVSPDYDVDPTTGAAVRKHGYRSLWGSHFSVPKVFRRRYSWRFHAYEYLLPTETPVNVNVNVDRWSQVFRRLITGSAESKPDICALAKRVRIKYSWTTRW